MTRRVRAKAFACLLRQEVAYFDRSENSSGAICARLSSDASAVQDMTGTRLGVICEALALSFFGILFGCFISRQLTIIIFVPLVILVIVTYGNVYIRISLNQQSGEILGRASTVRSHSYLLSIYADMKTNLSYTFDKLNHLHSFSRFFCSLQLKLFTICVQ